MNVEGQLRIENTWRLPLGQNNEVLFVSAVCVVSSCGALVVGYSTQPLRLPSEGKMLTARGGLRVGHFRRLNEWLATCAEETSTITNKGVDVRLEGGVFDVCVLHETLLAASIPSEHRVTMMDVQERKGANEYFVKCVGTIELPQTVVPLGLAEVRRPFRGMAIGTVGGVILAAPRAGGAWAAVATVVGFPTAPFTKVLGVGSKVVGFTPTMAKLSFWDLRELSCGPVHPLRPSVAAPAMAVLAGRDEAVLVGSGSGEMVVLRDQLEESQGVRSWSVKSKVASGADGAEGPPTHLSSCVAVRCGVQRRTRSVLIVGHSNGMVSLCCLPSVLKKVITVATTCVRDNAKIQGVVTMTEGYTLVLHDDFMLSTVKWSIDNAEDANLLRKRTTRETSSDYSSSSSLT